MREVRTSPPSFPEAVENQLLTPQDNERWQVLCGDADHWRLGIYSPEVGSADDIEELEWHDCPELFMLMNGRVSLLLRDENGERTVELEPNKPIHVTCYHAGFCPDGPFTGQALVIERDAFNTIYKRRDEF